MKKTMAVSVAVVLLIGVSAFAQVDNADNGQQLLFTAPHMLSSSLSVFGPDGLGTVTMTPVVITMNQTDSANSGQTLANQHITGTIAQVGTATTDGSGSIGLTQALDVQTVGLSLVIPPGQNQVMEGDGDATQSQGLQVLGTQTLTKAAGGIASGNGTNHVVGLSLVQNVAGSGTTGTNDVLINGLQTVALSGAPNATGTISTNLSIITIQNQEIK